MRIVNMWQRVRSVWTCRRECGVVFNNGHPWVVYSCDNWGCRGSAYRQAHQVLAQPKD